MYKIVFSLLFLFLLSCKATTYYVVRHAEKEAATTMTSDVPLSVAGRQRAEALKELFQKEQIQHIFSTNYIRTRSTVQPLADALNIPVSTYDPRDTGFVSRVRALHGNTLIVGHSNTVDDLVNALGGKKLIGADLADAEYGDLFIVRKKGKRISFEKKHFGQ